VLFIGGSGFFSGLGGGVVLFIGEFSDFFSVETGLVVLFIGGSSFLSGLGGGGVVVLLVGGSGFFFLDS